MTDPRAHEEPRWPALGTEELVWEGGGVAPVGPAATAFGDYGARYLASLPPEIRNLTPGLGRATAELAFEATAELSRFDREFGHRLQAFAPVLLRSEAASSSQIEHLSASARQIFTAEAGGKASRNAVLIASNSRAMVEAMTLGQSITSEAIRRMHAVLMEGQANHTPGEFRREAVWIGKRAESPIGAEYVAPAHQRIPGLVEDLCAFSDRRDIQPLAHVAIAHAQFETIHPFTDGNGRTGRALAQAMLRAEHVTLNVAVPVSAGLLSSVENYHEALTQYRAGDVEPIVERFAGAALRAVPNSAQLVDDLARIRETWNERVKRRPGSVRDRILDHAAAHPAFTAESIAAALGLSPTNVYRDLRMLQEASILSIDPQHGGITLWRAQEILDAIDRFAARSIRRSAL